MNSSRPVLLFSCFLLMLSNAIQREAKAAPVDITPAIRSQLNASMQLATDASNALDVGQFATAESDARKSLALFPANPVATEVVPKALAGEGKKNEAANAYAQLYSEGEESPGLLLPYSLLLLKGGDWKDALDVYNRALPHIGSMLEDGHKLLAEDSAYSYADPQPTELETDIHIAMGFAYIDDLGRSGPTGRTRALEEYKQALKLSPDSPLANLAYAHGLEEVGKEADAKAAYKEVARKYSGDVKAVAEDAALGPGVRIVITPVHHQ